jgi:hypothetical protein
MSATKSVAFVVVWWILVLGASFALAQDAIQFDVPVVVEACKVPSELDGSNERLIEVVVPVSTLITGQDRDSIKEFNFQVHWNRNVYPLVDYAPRTQMQSSVEGLITVEERQEKNSNLGFHATGSLTDVLNANANVGTSQKRSETLRFNQIPDQEILVASGTIQRGTGAFFRFHPSKQFTLEGGRDLIVTFRVPMNWRGGVLRVACSAEGKRKLFAGLTEPVTASKNFVVPVYLKGDDQARQIAIEYVQSELNLRRSWATYRNRVDQANDNFLTKLENTLSGRTDFGVPGTWATDLIESGADRALVKYQRALPANVRELATDFSNSRNTLYRLSQ